MSTTEGMGSIPGDGTKVPHVTWLGRKKKERDKLVLVCAQVGKEFSDTRQNERIEFIREETLLEQGANSRQSRPLRGLVVNFYSL